MDSIATRLFKMIDGQMLPRNVLAEHVIGVRLFDGDGRDAMVLFTESEASEMIESKSNDIQIEIFKRLCSGETLILKKAKKRTRVNE